MKIHDMFQRDIDRNINGVVQVSDESAARQELEEYVVTKELRRHLATFFDRYDSALDMPTENVGVWVSGYFGSGKSHLVKMLSYLLENDEVAGKRAVDYFEGKVGDSLLMENIRRAAEVPTESILFNVDVKGGGYKEGGTAKTALLRTFARVFYDHLGFYGTDYKLALFEKMIDDKGGTQRFREAYESEVGASWTEDRDAYEFHTDEIARAAEKAVGLSRTDVERWADSDSGVPVSLEQLVSDIKGYVARRKVESGGRFRLLFMADEVGQYIGSDANLMLNLQSLVELVGSECQGDVWLVVTSQEAIDETQTIVANDFSKIQGRFATRLQLSSSSVDEVIKRRILQKSDDATSKLGAEWERSSAVLRNLFSFDGHTNSDLIGYRDRDDFVQSYPFVSYQFVLMPPILNELRKHGYSGKHISTGERSMLSSFQESAQAVEDEDLGALVPLWRVFDTLESQMDHGIRQVFERCRRACEDGRGLQTGDVDVLKTLYMVVYVGNQIEATPNNVAVLMASGIDQDVAALRGRVSSALDRLVGESYVSREGERYSFLTDQEQDVEREIMHMQVDSMDVVGSVDSIIFDGIYDQARLRRGPNDFPIDRYVDGTLHGRSQNGMELHVITCASELSDASDAELGVRSMGCAYVVLPGDAYFRLVQDAVRVRKYVRGINMEAQSEERRGFIERRQRQASEDMRSAQDNLAEAVLDARAFVNGQRVEVKAANAKDKLDGVLERLAGAVFTKAGDVGSPLQSDAQMDEALRGRVPQGLSGQGAGNERAEEDVAGYLTAAERTNQAVSYGDLQRHFQEKPYGWREADIAYVVAGLVGKQKASISYGGANVPAADSRARGYLTNRSNFDRLSVRVRHGVPAHLVTGARGILRELDSTIELPSDEDGLVGALTDALGRLSNRCEALLKQYRGHDYPGERDVAEAKEAAAGVLRGSRDPEAFLRSVVTSSDALVDALDDVRTAEGFFSNQRRIFDDAEAVRDRVKRERTYIEGKEDLTSDLATIEQILKMPEPYGRISELPRLVQHISNAYGDVLRKVRESTLEELNADLQTVIDYAEANKAKACTDIGMITSRARAYISGRREEVSNEDSCTRVDAISKQAENWVTAQYEKIDNAVQAAAQRSFDGAGVHEDAPQSATRPATLRCRDVCPPSLLSSEEEVCAYVGRIKEALMDAVRKNGSVRLS
jgi:hypothetical protein